MKYYIVRENKVVDFFDVEDPSLVCFSPEDLQSLKEVKGTEDFVQAENGFYYLREDLTSPEYLKAMEEFHRIEDIRKLHRFLLKTDYVVIKIQEAQLEGNSEEVENLKTKYKDTLTQRSQARARLNELEND